MKNWAPVIGLLLTGLLLPILVTGCRANTDDVSAPVPIAAPVSSPPVVASNDSTPAVDQAIAALVGKGMNLTMKYDALISQSGPMDALTVTIWQKGGKLREEKHLPGNIVTQIIDRDNLVTYTYGSSQTYAHKTALARSSKSGTSFSGSDLANIPGYQPQILGADIIDGKTCSIIQLGRTFLKEKIWVWQEKGVPLRVEVTRPQGPQVIEFRDYDFSDIAESMFEMPAGLEIIDTGLTNNVPANLLATLITGQ